MSKRGDLLIYSGEGYLHALLITDNLPVIKGLPASGLVRTNFIVVEADAQRRLHQLGGNGDLPRNSGAMIVQ